MMRTGTQGRRDAIRGTYGVLTSHEGSSLGRQVVKLDGGDSRVGSRDDTLGNLRIAPGKGTVSADSGILAVRDNTR